MFANIILLAHAVVPHHHYPHKYFLLTAETCEEESLHHNIESSNSDHNHNHDSKSDNEHCLLNQVVGLPTNIARQAYGFNSHVDLQPDFGGYPTHLFYFQFECVVTSASLRLRPPLLAFSYISYASSVLGLRAPPAV